MLKYKIVYSSRTGNTGFLAAAIYQGLMERSKDIEELTGIPDGMMHRPIWWDFGQTEETVLRIRKSFFRNFPEKMYFYLEPVGLVPIRSIIIRLRSR